MTHTYMVRWGICAVHGFHSEDAAKQYIDRVCLTIAPNIRYRIVREIKYLMACDDNTPWSVTYHPYTVNRLRVTAGGGTDQSTGGWTPEATSSIAVYGSLGRAVAQGSKSTVLKELEYLAGAQFKTGDQYFMCHTDCDIDLNDILEAYDNAAGTTKTYWRVIMQLKTLTTFQTLRGYGMDYWLVRREER